MVGLDLRTVGGLAHGQRDIAAKKPSAPGHQVNQPRLNSGWHSHSFLVNSQALQRHLRYRHVAALAVRRRPALVAEGHRPGFCVAAEPERTHAHAGHSHALIASHRLVLERPLAGTNDCRVYRWHSELHGRAVVGKASGRNAEHPRDIACHAPALSANHIGIHAAHHHGLRRCCCWHRHALQLHLSAHGHQPGRRAQWHVNGGLPVDRAIDGNHPRHLYQCGRLQGGE